MFRIPIFHHIPKCFSSSQLFQTHLKSGNKQCFASIFMVRSYFFVYKDYKCFPFSNSTTCFIQQEVSIGLETAHIGNASWGNSELESIGTVIWKNKVGKLANIFLQAWVCPSEFQSDNLTLKASTLSICYIGWNDKYLQLALGCESVLLELWHG